MPFKKMKDGTYRSPSGKKWTGRQVRAYEATNGFRRPIKGGRKTTKKRY